MKATQFWRVLSGALMALAVAVFAGCGGHEKNPLAPGGNNPPGGGGTTIYDILPGSASGDTYGTVWVNSPTDLDWADAKFVDGMYHFLVYIDAPSGVKWDNPGNPGTAPFTYTLSGIATAPNGVSGTAFNGNSRAIEFVFPPQSQALPMGVRVRGDNGSLGWAWGYPAVFLNTVDGTWWLNWSSDGHPTSAVGSGGGGGGGGTGFTDLMDGDTSKGVTITDQHDAWVEGGVEKMQFFLDPRQGATWVSPYTYSGNITDYDVQLANLTDWFPSDLTGTVSGNSVTFDVPLGVVNNVPCHRIYLLMRMHNREQAGSTVVAWVHVYTGSPLYYDEGSGKIGYAVHSGSDGVIGGHCANSAPNLAPTASGIMNILHASN